MLCIRPGSLYIEPVQPGMEELILRESHGKAPEQYLDGDGDEFIIFLG